MSKKHTWRDLPKHTWRIKVEEVEGHKVRIKQKREHVRIDSGYMYFTIERLQEQIDEHGLTEVDFETDVEYDYGNQTTVMYMNGWRDATEKEIREALDLLDTQSAEQDARQAESARRQLEALRVSNPALFEEALKAIAKEKEG